MGSLLNHEKTREQLLEELQALQDRLACLEQARGPGADAGEAASRPAAIVGSAQGAIIGKMLEGVVTSWNLLESAPDAMIIVDQGGTIVLVNNQAETMFGYQQEELVGAPIEMLVPERYRAEHLRQREGFITSPRVRPMGDGRRLLGRRKDGHEFPVEISLSPLRSDAGLLVMSAIRDITQRERLLDDLRKAEVRYRTLVEEIPAVTFLVSLEDAGNDLRELYVSPQIEALLGFTQKEWLEDPVLWHRQLHPEDRDRWNVEFAPTVAEGEPFSSVYRFVARDGRVVWVRGEAKVIKDDAGQPLYLQGIAFDITAIKEAEEKLKKLNQTLDERVKERTAAAEQRAQELARSNRKLEVFAYTVSHDLKEPLRNIKQDTQQLQRLLQEQKDNLTRGVQDLTRPVRTTREDAQKLQASLQSQEGEIQKSLGYILESVGTWQRLLEDLEAYSEVGLEERLRPVSCTEVCEAARNSLRAAIEGSGATVTADPLPRLPGVDTELIRLFQNLINNAIKYRKPGRTAQIHVGARRQEDDWLFWVRDNGMGIKEENFEKIFGVGQKSRLHPRSKYPGTGFGLAICKQIIESRGGSIWVESQFGEGSTFYFTLPAADDKVTG